MRLPTYFLSHGGGPWPWMQDDMPGVFTELARSLAAIPAQIGGNPKAVLMVSGHWEDAVFAVQSHARPPMIYDFGGFPEHTYHVQYAAPGAPLLAARVKEMIERAGLTSRLDPERGFDHGCYTPLAPMFPDADVPVVQLALRRDLDPAAHVAVGRALAPLRDEGVLILGSGLSFHNLRMFGQVAQAPSAAFDGWLDAALKLEPARRTPAVCDWTKAPSARVAHPREDHLIPLMVALGAAEGEAAQRVYHERAFMGGWCVSSYRFG